MAVGVPPTYLPVFRPEVIESRMRSIVPPPAASIASWGGAIALAIVSTACSGPSALDGSTKPVAGGEAAAVRKKSDEALAKKEYELAWNHEVHAGKDRGRLEAIALAALEADDGAASDMFEQLRKAHGGLTEGGRSRVASIAVAAEGGGKWDRAAQIHVMTADDPPTYKQAWDVYARAPAKDALDILKRIEKARVAHEEAGKKPGT